MACVLHVGRQGRDYTAAPPDDFCGTADLVAVCPGMVIVYDYKTTQPGQTPADASDQLRALSLMAARAYGKPKAAYAAIIVDENGCWPEDLVTLDAFDLDGIAAELRALLEKDHTNSEPTPGPHCSERYCPARAACPVTTGAMGDTLVKADRLIRHKFSEQIATPDHAAWLLTACELVEDGLKAVRGQLRAYADEHGGIALSDGSVWAGSEVTTERPDLTVPGALGKVPSAAIEQTATWSGIEKAVGKAEAKAVREALQALGAVRSSSFRKYSASKPKLGKKAKS